jgi:hypothetical protein
VGIAAQLLEQRRNLALWAAGRQVAAEVSRHDALDQIIGLLAPAPHQALDNQSKRHHSQDDKHHRDVETLAFARAALARPRIGRS